MEIYIKENDKLIRLYTAQQAAELVNTSIGYLNLLRTTNSLEKKGLQKVKIYNIFLYKLI